MLPQNCTSHLGTKRRPRPRPRISKNYSSKLSVPLEPLPFAIPPQTSCKSVIQKDTTQVELQIVQNILDLVKLYSRDVNFLNQQNKSPLAQHNALSDDPQTLVPSSDSQVEHQSMQQTHKVEQKEQLKLDLTEQDTIHEMAISIPNLTSFEDSFIGHEMAKQHGGHRLTDPEQPDYGEMTVEEIRAYEKSRMTHIDPEVKKAYKQDEKEFRKNTPRIRQSGCDACKRKRSLCHRCDILKKMDDQAKESGANVPPREIWTSDQDQPHGRRLPKVDELEIRAKPERPATTVETFQRVHVTSIFDRCAKKRSEPPKQLRKPRPPRDPSEDSVSDIQSDSSVTGLVSEPLVEPRFFITADAEVSCSAPNFDQFHRLKDDPTRVMGDEDHRQKGRLASVVDGSTGLMMLLEPGLMTPPISPPTSLDDGSKRISRKQNHIKKSHCWNCWDEHPRHSCPDPSRSIFQKEQLRRERGIEAPHRWTEILRQSGMLTEGTFDAERQLDSSYKAEIEICWNCWKEVHNRKYCPVPYRQPQVREDERRNMGIKPSLHYIAWQKRHKVVVSGPGTLEWEPPSKCWHCRQYGHLPEACTKFDPVPAKAIVLPPEVWDVQESVEVIKDTREQKPDVSEPEGGNTASDGSTYTAEYDDNVSETSFTNHQHIDCSDGLSHPHFGQRVDYLCMMPTEILDAIFTYLSAGDLNKVPDSHQANYIRTGALELSIVEWNTRHIRKTCWEFHNIIQRKIYSFVHIQSLRSFEGFVRSVVNYPELGSFVEDVRVDIQQALNSFKSLKVHRSTSLGRNLGPTILKMLETCPNIHTLSAMSWGAVGVLDILDGHYPSMKRLSLKDDNDTSKSYRHMWRNLQRCPNLEEFTVSHTENNLAVDFEGMRIHPSLYVTQMHYQYRQLRCLKLVRSAEISDDNLRHLLMRMGELRTLELTDCKLITSSGLANALDKMKQNQLHHLRFVLYRDAFNNPTELELETRDNGHLCKSIRENCSQKLKSLHYSPHRVCGCLFQDSVWRNLQKLVFETMDFVGCKETTNRTRNDLLSSFDSIQTPRLRWPAQLKLGIPHIHFQRPHSHVDDLNTDTSE